MKKTSTIVILFTWFFISNIFARSFFNAKTTVAGELADVIGDKADNIDSLIVEGPINSADFKTMWSCAFYGSTEVINLEKAEVEDGKIPDAAFWNSKEQNTEYGIKTLKLRRIVLGESVKEIGQYAFVWTQLEEINFPKSLHRIGVHCFSRCYNLKTSPMVIPEGITEIPDACFASCYSLTHVLLPSSLIKIAKNAFNNSGVTDINFPYGLEIIGTAAFEGCNIKEVHLPLSCLDLGEMAFSNNIRMEKIYLPEGLTTIPSSLVSDNISLKEVSLPCSVKTIGNNAFSNCLALPSIKLPKGLVTIEREAFSNCTSVEEIVLPLTIKQLDVSCFKDMPGVKKIYCESKIPPLCGETILGEEITVPFGKIKGGISYGSTSPDIPLYVPVGSSELYHSTSGWNYFNNFIETDDFPTEIHLMEQTHNNIKVYAGNSAIVINAENNNAPANFTVFSSGGKQVYRGTVNATTTFVPCNRGYYIVKIGMAAYKVIVN